jgi:hypothetical protein
VCCLFSLEDSRLDLFLMVLVPRTTNGATPTPGEPFVFLSYGNVGPPYSATLSLLGLTIGLLVWLFSTPVILNVVSDSYVLEIFLVRGARTQKNGLETHLYKVSDDNAPR